MSRCAFHDPILRFASLTLGYADSVRTRREKKIAIRVIARLVVHTNTRTHIYTYIHTHTHTRATLMICQMTSFRFPFLGLTRVSLVLIFFSVYPFSPLYSRTRVSFVAFRYCYDITCTWRQKARCNCMSWLLTWIRPRDLMMLQILIARKKQTIREKVKDN